jgi:3'-phosphoadenosine 5'-phosphosulfate sulfotransferase (PAPS reductase)/FAD synthetase
LEISKRIIIETFSIPDVNFCLMWSGGKDSSAMVHLVRVIDPSIPIFSQFDDCDWPEKRPYMDRVAERHGWDFISVEPGFSVWEAVQNHKIGTENICGIDHPITIDAFIMPLKAATRASNCDGIFLGLRSDESYIRKKNFQKRRHTYQLKDGTWRCCPLSMWSTRDVFAYLVSNDVEINPCYFYNAICHPEEIRLSWALPTVGWKGRDIEHIRRYYPQQFRRLREKGLQ